MPIMYRSFLFALTACLIFMGLALTPWYTVSPRLNIAWLHRGDECQPIGKNWDCWKPERKNYFMNDGGAISWAEMTSAYFFNQSKETPKWNPYIGSGYPIFLDGHSRNISPSRIWLNFFPSDNGRDFLVFFRFLIMTWGVATLLLMYQVRSGLTWLACLFTTMAPYLTSHLDHVFLDVDMMAPWALVWLQFGFKRQNEEKSNFLFLLFGFVFGLWIGLQTFIESQATFGIFIFLSCMAFLPLLKKNAIWGLCSFSLGFFLLALPQAIEYLKYFDILLSNRIPTSCFAEKGLLKLASGWKEIFFNSFSGFYRNPNEWGVFSFFGILTFPLLLKNKQFRPYFVIFLAVLIFVLWGLPKEICQLKGINGIHFWRHFLIIEQILFILFCTLAIHLISRKFEKKSQIISFVLVIICLVPFIKRNIISLELFKGEYAQEKEFFPEKIPDHHAFSNLQRLSQNEDRRHFSPDERLYPNWSASLKILDLRVLYAFYPKWTFELYHKINPFWEKQGLHYPDRFVRFNDSVIDIDEAIAKNLVLSRVSLLSFSSQKNWLPEKGIYSKANCLLLKDDKINQVWLCPQIAGVGFFPKQVEFINSDELFFTLVNSNSAENILNKVWISIDDSENEKNKILPDAAEGRVDQTIREADTLEYHLTVTKAGFFVVADSWFPGWNANIDGQETKLYRANYAFKAVWVEAGKHNLQFKFKK